MPAIALAVIRDLLLKSVGEQRIGDSGTIREPVGLSSQEAGDRGALLKSSELIPVRHCHPVDLLLKSFLKSIEICPMPRWEQHIAMVTIIATRYSVIASDGEI